MGYDAAFLGSDLVVEAPGVRPDLVPDLVLVEGSPVIGYTHFSLAQSTSRRLARWVAWNIDGARFDHADEISRDGVDFRPDPRVPRTAQTLDDVYASNSLDRGHLARRSDLLWGPLAEARRANEDSFFFTNIAPQRSSFNQSGAAGVWGLLEDALLASTRADALRVDVLAGPVLAADDLPYRGTRVPTSFWKVVAYATEGALQVRAFLLTQDLDDLEPVVAEQPDPLEVALGPFAVLETDLADLAARTGLVLDPALLTAEAARRPARAGGPRRLLRASDVTW